MAVVNPTVTRPSDNVIRFSYLLANGDTGAPIPEIYGDYSDRSVQWSGAVFGVGGSVSIEGSANGTNFIVLTDPQGNVLTKTAVGLEQIMEGFPMMRPNCTAGDGTTAITATITCRRPRIPR